MPKLRFEISMSVDGFVAGPNQSEEHPLGEGGMQLHEWVFELAAWREPHGREGGEVNASTPVVEEGLANIGAGVMGRNMFGGGPGPWGDDPWNGWWGDDPPFHMSIFVLTHHEREPLEMQGGTTTRCSSTSRRSCSGTALASSTTWRASTLDWSSSRSSTHPASPTSGIAS